MNPIPPVRLSVALCFALIAIFVYWLQPDSEDVSFPEPAPVPPSPLKLAASVETAAESSPENAAPSEPGESANIRLPADIVPTSSRAAGTQPHFAAAAPPEIRNAPTLMQTNHVRKPRDLSNAPDAATTLRALTPAGKPPATFAAVTVAQSAQATSSTQETAAPVPLAKFPAAFVEPDTAVPLTETQKETVNVLQKEFIDAIGGPDQDPADPEYFRRWQSARLESDQRFKTLFGVQAFLERERAANMAGVGATAQ